MATLLLVEDQPDLGLVEAPRLEERGHRVIRCGGGPGAFGRCTLLGHGDCPLPSSADLIVFSVPLFGRLRGRMYRGIDLLRAYRAHPLYSRLPCLIVSVGDPGPLEGTGPVAVIDKFSAPGAVIDHVERLTARV